MPKTTLASLLEAQMPMSGSGTFAPVVTSDVTDLPNTTVALIVSVGGTLKVNDEFGVARALTVPAGVLPLRVSRVWATGTAATGITACF